MTQEPLYILVILRHVSKVLVLVLIPNSIGDRLQSVFDCSRYSRVHTDESGEDVNNGEELINLRLRYKVAIACWHTERKL